jgi:hypothetical protein
VCLVWRVLLYAWVLVSKFIIIDVFPDPADPIIAMKYGQFGSGGSTCL